MKAMTSDKKTSSSLELLNPQMLTLAREYAGFTQTELAKELSVSQGTVSKLEEGLYTGDQDLIEKLSAIFDRPVDFFTQRPSVSMTLEGHFRKKSSLTKKLLRATDARMNIERFQINKLLDSCDLELPGPPSCNPDEYPHGAKEIARLIRQYLNLPAGPVENVVEAVEKAGCFVRFIDFGTLLVDGFAVLSEANVPIIFVNKAFPADRRRLTLAHEFGHVIMHRGQVRSNIEDEAFEFAGEFLMPEREIKPSLYPLNLQKLARQKLKWKVSMAAILQHAKKMGAVNDRYYRYMRSELAKNGYTKQEPHEAAVAFERPKALTQVFRHFKSDLEYDIDDMCRLLSATEKEVKSLNQPNHERFHVV